MYKIIHCITTICRGGAENQLLILVKEQIKNGNEVIVIYLKGAPELRQEFIKCGAEVLDFLVGKNPIFQVMILKKYLVDNRAVLHAHLPRAELLCAISNSGNRFIISKHNSEKFFPKAPNGISRLLSLLVLQKASQCICISDAVGKFLKSIGELRSDTDYRVVHYGISLKNNKSVNSKNVDNKNFEKFIVGTIGRIVEQKDYPTLLKAFAIFHNEYANSELLIVGDGDLKQEVIRFAQALGIQENIKWLGRTEDVFSILKKFDVFVLASKYEGFGLVLLEAMQTRVPIVAADNSAISEVLGLNYPGLFKTGDAQDLCIKIKEVQFTPMDLVEIMDKRLIKFDSREMYKKIDYI